MKVVCNISICDCCGTNTKDAPIIAFEVTFMLGEIYLCPQCVNKAYMTIKSIYRAIPVQYIVEKELD